MRIRSTVILLVGSIARGSICLTDFSKQYPWWEDAARLRVGLLHRPQPQVPHLTHPKWDAELHELDLFAAWVLWVANGREGQRPAFYQRVPGWAWHVCGEYILKHDPPKPKPAPAPPPPPKPPASWTFEIPVVFTAWQPDLAREGDWLIATRVVNDGSWAAWAVDGGWIAQAESVDQQQKAVDWLKDKTGSRAVVATQGGWVKPSPGGYDSTVDQFLAIGVNVVFGEAYQNDGGPSPDRICWQALHDGWPYAYPVAGCYHGYPLSNYDLSPWGRNFGVYLAEEMSDDDWKTLAE